MELYNIIGNILKYCYNAMKTTINTNALLAISLVTATQT